ncbi:MAG: hypothetical protein ACLTUL_16435 [Blautia faecis]
MAVSEAIQALTHNFYSEQRISVFESINSEESAELSVENSLNLYQIESSLNNWAFQEASSVSNHIFPSSKAVLPIHRMQRISVPRFTTSAAVYW